MDGSHILIVEDDTLISTYLEDKLRGSFQVTVVQSTQAARAVLEKGGVTLIVLDIMLPDENGFEFLEDLKKAGSAYRNIPVLMLSNLGQPEDKARAMKLGATDYLVKANQLPQNVVDAIKRILTTSTHPPTATPGAATLDVGAG